MTDLNLGEAHKILKKPEYKLFLASHKQNIAELTKKSLKAKIKRAKKLLDKFKTKKMASKRLVKGRGLETDKITLKKKKKILYITEAKKRFMTQLKALEKAVLKKAPKAQKATKKTPHLKLIKASERASSKVNRQSRAQNTRTNAKKRKLTKSGLERKRGHMSSRNRRHQGRKDARTSRAA